jgi:hypothetical protein
MFETYFHMISFCPYLKLLFSTASSSHPAQSNSVSLGSVSPGYKCRDETFHLAHC